MVGSVEGRAHIRKHKNTHKHSHTNIQTHTHGHTLLFLPAQKVIIGATGTVVQHRLPRASLSKLAPSFSSALSTNTLEDPQQAGSAATRQLSARQRPGKQQQQQAAPVAANVQEARDWIANFQSKEGGGKQPAAAAEDRKNPHSMSTNWAFEEQVCVYVCCVLPVLRPGLQLLVGPLNTVIAC